MIKKIFFVLIEIYQKIFSPDRGLFSFLSPSGACRFYPNCSDYAKNAIEKYGVMKGSVMGAKRILKCNPLNKGGVDLLK